MMPPLPPLNLNLHSGADSKQDTSGSSFMASGPGNWTVNVAGSGTANQSASGGGIPWMWILIAGAAWFLLKK